MNIDDLDYRFIRGGEGLSRRDGDTGPTMLNFDRLNVRVSPCRVNCWPRVAQDCEAGEYDSISGSKLDGAVNGALFTDLRAHGPRCRCARLELARGQALTTGKVISEELASSQMSTTVAAAGHTNVAAALWSVSLARRRSRTC